MKDIKIVINEAMERIKMIRDEKRFTMKFFY